MLSSLEIQFLAGALFTMSTYVPTQLSGRLLENACFVFG